jgi:hypothetical protein
MIGLAATGRRSSISVTLEKRSGRANQGGEHHYNRRLTSLCSLLPDRSTRKGRAIKNTQNEMTRFRCFCAPGGAFIVSTVVTGRSSTSFDVARTLFKESQLACQVGTPREIGPAISSKLLVRNVLQAVLQKWRSGGDPLRAIRFDDEAWSC